MTNKFIEVIVSPKGETSVQTKGFTGAECQDASKALEQAIGAQTAEQKTPEYFQLAQDIRNEVSA